MNRSDANAFIMRSLQGIREATPSLDERIEEIHGAFERFMGSMNRVPGKMSVSTSSSRIVWSLTQLQFRERDVIVTRNSSCLSGNVGVWSPPPGLVFDMPPLPEDPEPPNPPWPEPPVPPMPEPISPDWPQNPPSGSGLSSHPAPTPAPPGDRMPSPIPPSIPRLGLVLNVTPGVLTIRLDEGEDSGLLTLTVSELGPLDRAEDISYFRYDWGAVHPKGLRIRGAEDDDFSKWYRTRSVVGKETRGYGWMLPAWHALYGDSNPFPENTDKVYVVPDASELPDISQFDLEVTAVWPGHWMPEVELYSTDGMKLRDNAKITVIKTWPTTTGVNIVTNPGVYPHYPYPNLNVNPPPLWDPVNQWWYKTDVYGYPKYITVWPNGMVKACLFNPGTCVTDFVGWPAGGPADFDYSSWFPGKIAQISVYII